LVYFYGNWAYYIGDIGICIKDGFGDNEQITGIESRDILISILILVKYIGGGLMYQELNYKGLVGFLFN
jgi:hypothetical protein